MRLLHPWHTLAALGLPLMALLAVTAQRYSATSLALVCASVILFLSAWWASTQILGSRNTRIFALLGLMDRPIETRAIAFFSMSIPILAATVAWWQWQQGDAQ
jgi:hypothetical protein